MAIKMHIKTGDEVVVLSGKDKGKKGKVLSVNPEKRMVIVEGVSVAAKHKKPTRMGETGGIIHQEVPIYACKVMHICNKCGKPTRIGYKTMADGTKSRMCKNCLEVLDD